MKRSRVQTAVLSGLLCAVLCACQPTPEAAVVASKNDGALEGALEESQTEVKDTSEDIYTDNFYIESFTNIDNDITFNMELEPPAEEDGMPVLRVRPKTISVASAKQVAEVLFGNADIYEHSENWSKAKLEEIILSLRQRLADSEAMETYYGSKKDSMAKQIEAVIEKYEDKYTVAPESVEESLCTWEFHPRSWYYDQSWADEDDPAYISDSKSQWIVADAEKNALPYVYSVCNREENDYRMHSITCEINWDLVDESLVYSSKAPSEMEVTEAQTTAAAMLENMNIGSWVIDSCVVREIAAMNGSAQYEIVVTACPVYNGVKVTRQKQLDNLHTEDAYASNYYYEEVIFSFSGDNLVSFQYRSPLEVVDVVNEDAAILPFETAAEKCKSQLQMSLLAADPYASNDFFEAARKEVNVYQVELGLVRTRVKNSSEDFYLLPAYTFRASYDLYDQQDTLVFDSTVLEAAGLIAKEIVVINAVDGSIINTRLGY